MSFPVQVLWKPSGKYNKSFSSHRCPQGKSLTISFFKIGNILTIFMSVERTIRKDERMYLEFDIYLPN